VNPTRPLEQVQEVGHELLRHLRLSQLLRARMSTWTPAGLDWSSTSLLIHLIKGGPQRQGELATCAMLDPSTVSRQVGQLVRLGLVERRPDPADGRAVQLAATPSGQELFAEIARRRDELIGEALAGWDDADLGTFVTLLRRLNDSFEQRLPDLSRAGPPPAFAAVHRPEPHSRES
jgi:DNA-binding MarR family transcriptional regulator